VVLDEGGSTTSRGQQGLWVSWAFFRPGQAGFRRALAQGLLCLFNGDKGDVTLAPRLPWSGRGSRPGDLEGQNGFLNFPSRFSVQAATGEGQFPQSSDLPLPSEWDQERGSSVAICVRGQQAAAGHWTGCCWAQRDGWCVADKYLYCKYSAGWLRGGTRPSSEQPHNVIPGGSIMMISQESASGDLACALRRAASVGSRVAVQHGLWGPDSETPLLS
jgi:hypothetical protein